MLIVASLLYDICVHCCRSVSNHILMVFVFSIFFIELLCVVGRIAMDLNVLERLNNKRVLKANGSLQNIRRR